MASKSRAYTRPGADPEGRFRPVPTPAQQRSAEDLQRALAPVQPSAVVRSEAWYGDQKKAQAAFLPGVWIGIVAAVVAVTIILTSV
ncbi:hypothetical protein [Streptomyces roseolus]|uniref:hypothetical protein n=1 Tax=Streptomyces roseolus TaxID=67358 RepID=UPI00364A7516